ncbi:MAG: hypothetical protein WHV44_03675 [Anaerolineales bacterium]
MPSPNRLALISLTFSALTVISFCIGWAPIPLTALVCYPVAVLGGLAAMLTGWMSLQRLAPGGRRWMAHTGLWIGGLTISAVICFSTFSLLLLPLAWNGFVQAGQTVFPAAGDWLAQLWQTLLLWLSETGWVN